MGGEKVAKWRRGDAVVMALKKGCGGLPKECEGEVKALGRRWSELNSILTTIMVKAERKTKGELGSS